MTKTLKPIKSPTAKGFTLGRRGFAKISAIEGIHLSPEMESKFREFDRDELPAGKRREAISRVFGKVR
jgi:hypothetical protein